MAYDNKPKPGGIGVNSFFRSLLLFLFSLVCLGLGMGIHLWFTLPEVEVWQKQNPQQTAFMRYRLIQSQMRGHRLRLRFRWVSLTYIPRHFQRAVILAEDASFWVHRGFDWHEVKAAMRENWKRGRVVRGGSTITQQLAKNLYLSPERSIYRKIKEMVITYRLERSLSKSRILELYLNIIELGPGIFGVGAASQYYFGIPPSRMSFTQAVLLAATIPAPLRNNPRRPTRTLYWRANLILNRLRFYGDIPDSTYLFIQNNLRNYFR